MDDFYTAAKMTKIMKHERMIYVEGIYYPEEMWSDFGQNEVANLFIL